MNKRNNSKLSREYNYHLPFQPFSLKKRIMKNGGKTIGGPYISPHCPFFFPPFLPFPFIITFPKLWNSAKRSTHLWAMFPSTVCSQPHTPLQAVLLYHKISKLFCSFSAFSSFQIGISTWYKIIENIICIPEKIACLSALVCFHFDFFSKKQASVQRRELCTKKIFMESRLLD